MRRALIVMAVMIVGAGMVLCEQREERTIVSYDLPVRVVQTPDSMLVEYESFRVVVYPFDVCVPAKGRGDKQTRMDQACNDHYNAMGFHGPSRCKPGTSWPMDRESRTTGCTCEHGAEITMTHGNRG